MPCLVDVNIWLALLVKEHVHHALARAWFEELGPNEAGLCRMVQLALLRLLGNRAIMAAGALPAAEAWNRIAELVQDERVSFHKEPPRLDSLLPALLSRAPAAGGAVTDAYLAAFAIGADLRFITFDRGFQQFRGLRLRLLHS